MRTHKLALALAAALVAAALAAAGALAASAPPRYKIDVVATGASPQGINESGQVVGWTSWPTLPFLYTDERGVTTLPTAPGFTDGLARAVNEAGDVAGLSGEAVRWRGGVLERLGSLQGDGTSQASGINDRGDVVGSSGFGFGHHAVLWPSDGGIVDLTPTLFNATAHAVNESGQVAGYANSVAFRWSGGVLQSLGTPDGFAYSFGFALNDAGQVAGSVKTSPGSTERLARWTDGVGWEILGGTGSSNIAYGINNHGVVVGTGRHSTTGYLIPSALAYYDGLGLYNLNELVATDEWGLGAAFDVNDAGQIVASATNRVTGESAAVRLTPFALRVASVSVSAAGGKGKTATPPTARVTVVGENGAPVVGATVTGDWRHNGSLVASGASAVTDAAGVATLTQRIKRVRRGDTIAFCVTAVEVPGFHTTYGAGEQCAEAVAD